jgi:twitching motility protein PilT
MICTPAIKAMIRDGKVHQIYSLIQAGQKYGMKTMNQSLMELNLMRKISLEDAFSRSTNPQELTEMMARRRAV